MWNKNIGTMQTGQPMFIKSIHIFFSLPRSELLWGTLITLANGYQWLFIQ